MRTVEEIDFEIKAVKKELEDVHGTETEVYARIVGYYRSVKNWNKGKKEEYSIRKNFVTKEEVFESWSTEDKGHDFSNFMLFTKATCPNCPPVKQYIDSMNIAGERIDVETDSGFKKAVSYGVMSTPTVIFFSPEGSELKRCHSVEEIKSFCI